MNIRVYILNTDVKNSREITAEFNTHENIRIENELRNILFTNFEIRIFILFQFVISEI